MDHQTEHYDPVGARFGMWVFLCTEILLFGGLFIVYSVLRHQYFQSFHDAAEHLNVVIGTINTVVLLASSAAVAMSITAIQKGDSKLALKLLAITIFCALIFMVNKYFEWSGKIHDGIYPGSGLMVELDRGYLLYYSLYFFMTGLHALHILIGLTLLIVIVIRIKSGRINKERYVLLENGALYWHLVDLIWIFLFPLLYLIT